MLVPGSGGERIPGKAGAAEVWILASGREYDGRCRGVRRAIHTLVRQRPPTPLCSGQSSDCEENSEPDRNNTESLTVHPELENSLDPFRTWQAFIDSLRRAP